MNKTDKLYLIRETGVIAIMRAQKLRAAHRRRRRDQAGRRARD